MTHRQPKLPLALRIIAAGCVVLWLAGVSACNLEALFCCDSHGDEAVAHTDERHSHHQHAADTKAHHSHTRERNSSRNNNESGGRTRLPRQTQSRALSAESM